MFSSFQTMESQIEANQARIGSIEERPKKTFQPTSPLTTTQTPFSPPSKPTSPVITHRRCHFCPSQTFCLAPFLPLVHINQNKRISDWNLSPNFSRLLWSCSLFCSQIYHIRSKWEEWTRFWVIFRSKNPNKKAVAGFANASAVICPSPNEQNLHKLDILPP